MPYYRGDEMFIYNHRRMIRTGSGQTHGQIGCQRAGKKKKTGCGRIKYKQEYERQKQIFRETEYRPLTREIIKNLMLSDEFTLSE